MTKQCSSCGGFCGKVCKRESINMEKFVAGPVVVPTKQPVALRLADAIDPRLQATLSFSAYMSASDELRRLHEVNAVLLKVMQNVEALGMLPPSLLLGVRVAIAKATGETE